MGRSPLAQSLGVGLFRARADGVLEHVDVAIARLLDEAAIAHLESVASEDGPVEACLGSARVIVKREGDALVGLVLLDPPPPRFEARWENRLLERASDGVVLARHGVVLRATRRAATLLGVEDERALVGQPLPERLRDASGEVRLALPSGARTVESARIPITHEGEDAELILIRDLTEQRILQAKLTQSDRVAAVGTLAASVAHEINNPLTYVMHYIEQLRRDLEDLGEAEEIPRSRIEKLREGASTAAEGCRRVRDIVRDLKAFGRLDDEQDVPLDVNRALRSALQMSGHRVRVVARLEVELGPVPPVRANDGRLCQVFLNLLMNAAQAIRPGTERSRARVEVKSWSDGAWVYVSVRDTGVGIAPEHLGRLFEPFFSTKAEGVGTGLGLWICRDIVTGIGGHIDVASAPGEGTTMTVVLPRAQGEAANASSSHPPPEPMAPSPFGTLRRVLVVDDEPAVLELLAEALGDSADVVTASDGHEAREILRHDSEFDAILCDLMMPGVGGVELFDWIDRARPKLAPRMIFMTGAAYSEDAREFLARVDNERLDKPFRVRDVERVLDRVIDGAARVHA
ncbi:MAG: response regulator [Sandaracinaceae bacterium]|nr:response regulator [Sandaracinaceae bacterium]